MQDKHLYMVAVLCAVIGLALLAIAPSTATERMILNGTVVSREGNLAQVRAVVPVQSARGKVGREFQASVFWDGERFVAISDNSSHP